MRNWKRYLCVYIFTSTLCSVLISGRANKKPNCNMFLYLHTDKPFCASPFLIWPWKDHKHYRAEELALLLDQLSSVVYISFLSLAYDSLLDWQWMENDIFHRKMVFHLVPYQEYLYLKQKIIKWFLVLLGFLTLSFVRYFKPGYNVSVGSFPILRWGIPTQLAPLERGSPSQWTIEINKLRLYKVLISGFSNKANNTKCVTLSSEHFTIGSSDPVFLCTAYFTDLSEGSGSKNSLTTYEHICRKLWAL